jgi:hypothetical protein
VAPDRAQQFPGFEDFNANVTFVPLQFFTVVLPNCSRGTVRIVGYAIRKLLGWVDEHGNPTRGQLRFTYKELIEKAGVSRDSIAEALQEAIERHCLVRVQSAQPDRCGQSAQSGIYELCWDNDGPYTDCPEEFRGFYYPEAAVVDVNEAGKTVSRPKAARKNIPNLYFDYLLPREPLSVIRVVGALLFYSIQWGPGGERKVPVIKSMTELSRLTRMSRSHVHAAVKAAVASGYIEAHEAGCFDPAAGKGSRPASYRIRWTKSAMAGFPQNVETDPRPVRNGEREFHRSEKVNGAPVGKGERTRSEKVNGCRSEKVNDISIKTELKKIQTATATAMGVGAFELLRKVGFDEKDAKLLARSKSQELIQQQIEWLPRRNITQSCLGMLRRAIEGNWRNPEDAGPNSPSPASMVLGKVFASNYYAAYHDFKGPAETEPFHKDTAMAAKFVLRLLSLDGDKSQIPDWGKGFGRLMREKHQGDPKAKPNLCFALVLFGDKFLRVLQQEVLTRKQAALGKARHAHQKFFDCEYLVYLRSAEAQLRERDPSLYETFEQNRQRVRQLMTMGPFVASADRIARFESDESRLLDLAAFFKDHPTKPVFNFWQWDARLNSKPFVLERNREEGRPETEPAIICPEGVREESVPGHVPDKI